MNEIEIEMKTKMPMKLNKNEKKLASLLLQEASRLLCMLLHNS